MGSQCIFPGEVLNGDGGVPRERVCMQVPVCIHYVFDRVRAFLCVCISVQAYAHVGCVCVRLIVYIYVYWGVSRGGANKVWLGALIFVNNYLDST